MGCIVSSSAAGTDLKKKNTRAKKAANQNFRSAPNSAIQA
jgi:hypothetical protein